VRDNALKHGILARETAIDNAAFGESPDEFAVLLAQLCAAGILNYAKQTHSSDFIHEEPVVNEPAVFVLADRALNNVVAQIKAGQWSMEMPASFVRHGTDHIPTLREIINYHAYDDAWVPDMLSGKTMDEAGSDTFKGDLLGDDPQGAFAAIVEKACAAALTLEDLDRTVHCSFGDYPARDYFWQINMFRGLRAHDIAKVIGVDAGLPDELVQGIWDEISPHAEEWRAIGVFPPAVPVPDDAPLLNRLLGLTGRDPNAV
jgi:uncharacterized protein (TIGR03086 family)